jgi:hypothetical protein
VIDEPGCEEEEFKAHTAEDAAEKFANYSFYAQNLYEFGEGGWGDDYSIVVIDEDGKMDKFAVEVISEPVFIVTKSPSNPIGLHDWVTR